MASFFTSYVLAAISSLQPGSKLYTPADITPDTMAQMKTDCESFQVENKVDLAFLDEGNTGRMFWHIRNGNVAYGEGIPGTRAQRLTDAAKAFGPYTLTVIDGTIYGEQG